eukprot:CAMPEP_0170456480 /NCGR_PEP_ID=MMETSP0123-20130129/4100_1 /TAXON_ID=182087 /ORGANISM="Favella ehrenbergii, Strain Fehren 1" /LENGTH=57 /DNA_ID=CAMNT_0010719971 /DNA_START=386 /DNA_END=559 /DNA_ORIENTATION=-
MLNLRPPNFLYWTGSKGKRFLMSLSMTGGSTILRTSAMIMGTTSVWVCARLDSCTII